MSCPQKFGCAPGVGLIITRLLSQAAGAHARHSCGNAESPCTLPPPRLASPGSACGTSRRHTVWCLCIRCPLGSTAVLVWGQLLSAAAAVKPLFPQARWLD